MVAGTDATLKSRNISTARRSAGGADLRFAVGNGETSLCLYGSEPMDKVSDERVVRMLVRQSEAGGWPRVATRTRLVLMGSISNAFGLSTFIGGRDRQPTAVLAEMGPATLFSPRAICLTPETMESKRHRGGRMLGFGPSGLQETDPAENCDDDEDQRAALIIGTRNLFNRTGAAFAAGAAEPPPGWVSVFASSAMPPAAPAWGTALCAAHPPRPQQMN